MASTSKIALTTQTIDRLAGALTILLLIVFVVLETVFHIPGSVVVGILALLPGLLATNLKGNQAVSNTNGTLSNLTTVNTAQNNLIAQLLAKLDPKDAADILAAIPAITTAENEVIPDLPTDAPAMPDPNAPAVTVVAPPAVAPVTPIVPPTNG